jgi:hypothetical protein
MWWGSRLGIRIPKTGLIIVGFRRFIVLKTCRPPTFRACKDRSSISISIHSAASHVIYGLYYLCPGWFVVRFLFCRSIPDALAGWVLACSKAGCPESLPDTVALLSSRELSPDGNHCRFLIRVFPDAKDLTGLRPIVSFCKQL